MSGQLGRHYSSPKRPIRGDAGPPPPGQAYFGYPQPSAGGFGVPQQQVSPAVGDQAAQADQAGQADPSGWPLTLPTRTTQKRPYRAHSSDSRSRRIWLHLLGYSLVAIAGTALGVVVAQHWAGLLWEVRSLLLAM